ncbi:hypothetical protein BV898_15600 [Hypsibius exemplaris]|uniref:Plexin-B n=1 Tax=Hypsibius exemplaris TaxID=2072580 RepID=A0A9X6NI46_HYPEX|nr:hypothetical protein BV898_15600 [Hypsibius exemplaris]
MHIGAALIVLLQTQMPNAAAAILQTIRKFPLTGDAPESVRFDFRSESYELCFRPPIAPIVLSSDLSDTSRGSISSDEPKSTTCSPPHAYNGTAVLISEERVIGYNASRTAGFFNEKFTPDAYVRTSTMDDSLQADDSPGVIYNSSSQLLSPPCTNEIRTVLAFRHNASSFVVGVSTSKSSDANETGDSGRPTTGLYVVVGQPNAGPNSSFGCLSLEYITGLTCSYPQASSPAGPVVWYDTVTAADVEFDRANADTLTLYAVFAKTVEPSAPRMRLVCSFDIDFVVQDRLSWTEAADRQTKKWQANVLHSALVYSKGEVRSLNAVDVDGSNVLIYRDTQRVHVVSHASFLAEQQQSSPLLILDRDSVTKEEIRGMSAVRSGRVLDVLTNTRLRQIDINPCGNLTTCTQCLTTRMDRGACGWCVLSQRCSILETCFTLKIPAQLQRKYWLKAVSTANESCPEITLLGNHVHTAGAAATASLDRPVQYLLRNFPPLTRHNLSITCSFHLSSSADSAVTVPVDSKGTELFECPLFRQEIFRNHTVNDALMEVELIVSDGRRQITLQRTKLTLSEDNRSDHQSPATMITTAFPPAAIALAIAATVGSCVVFFSITTYRRFREMKASNEDLEGLLRRRLSSEGHISDAAQTAAARLFGDR